MATCYITYDAHRQRDYQHLYLAMDACGGVRLAESVWGLTIDASPVSIRDWVSNLLDGDDTVEVFQIWPFPSWATRNASASAVDWLSDHVAVREFPRG